MAYLNLFTNTKKPLSIEPEAAGDWACLNRFLILGSEDGIYYAGGRPAALRNLSSVKECLRSDGLRAVRAVVEIATSGRAPSNEPALEVLALAASSSFASALTNATALAALPEVARTAIDLLVFAAFVDQVRGWGRGLRTAVANWYLSKPPGELAYQIMTNPGHGDWKHADLIRLSHPNAETPALNAVFQWAVDGVLGHLATADIRHGELSQVFAFEQVNRSTSEREVVSWIEDVRLTHELIPREWKQSARVWEALLENMPYPHMVSQLGKMTEVGLLVPHSAAAALVVARLMDRKRVSNAKVDPFTLLSAAIEYRQNKGLPSILNALEDALYLAFDNIDAPVGDIYLTIDSKAPVEWAAVIGMAVVRGKGKSIIATFHEGLRHLSVSVKDRFGSICQAVADQVRPANAFRPVFSLAMEDARQRGALVNTFIFVVDKPTWPDDRSPGQALLDYRQATGISAKLVVIGTAADEGAIGNSMGLHQLHVAGFDASVPCAVAEFLRLA
jgi:60 kDa SS-A/Ro ribonucleoprotein